MNTSGGEIYLRATPVRASTDDANNDLFEFRFLVRIRERSLRLVAAFDRASRQFRYIGVRPGDEHLFKEIYNAWVGHPFESSRSDDLLAAWNLIWRSVADVEMGQTPRARFLRDARPTPRSWDHPA